MRNRPTFEPHEDFNFESINMSDISQQTVERESRFEINESGRQANETSRQTNELVREENELARESAESVRVSNEEERISKDSERDSKIEVVEGNLESKANKQQEDWITPTLLNGWEDVPYNQILEYMKDEFGFVHISGVATGGLDRHVFTLPSDYIPNYTVKIGSFRVIRVTGQVFFEGTNRTNVGFNINYVVR